MPSTVQTEPAKLAKYLQVTLNQRKRGMTKLTADYGADSAAVHEAAAEVSDLEIVINGLIKDAAKAPLRK